MSRTPRQNRQTIKKFKLIELIGDTIKDILDNNNIPSTPTKINVFVNLILKGKEFTEVLIGHDTIFGDRISKIIPVKITQNQYDRIKQEIKNILEGYKKTNPNILIS